MTQKLPQIYTANHATFPIRIRKLTVQICGNFWVTQYKAQKIIHFAHCGLCVNNQSPCRSLLLCLLPTLKRQRNYSWTFPLNHKVYLDYQWDFQSDKFGLFQSNFYLKQTLEKRRTMLNERIYYIYIFSLVRPFRKMRIRILGHKSMTSDLLCSS